MGRPFFNHARRIQGRWWAVFAGDLVVAGLWFWLADGGGDLVRAVALVGGVLALVCAVVFFVIGYSEARKSSVKADAGSRR